METTLKYMRQIRGVIMRNLKTRDGYMSSFSTKPISTKYGFDRGIPIDRFYIEKFLGENKSSISGICLEIVDNKYTNKFGGDKILRSDVLDIIKRRTTTIHGDLRNLKEKIPDNIYDTIIVTQTLNVIDDYESTIKECYRILKPGGKLFVTLPTISPTWNLKINFWRFTVISTQYVFGKYFKTNQLSIASMGNKISSECFWLGMAVEDMKPGELENDDQSFPLIITVVAYK